MAGTNLIKLEKAEHLERLGADIYRALAGYFTDQPGATAMFERLEREEIQHALRVHMLMHLYLEQPGELQSLSIDERSLDRTIAQAERVLASLRVHAAPISLDQARRLMVALERRFAEVHAEHLARDANPALAKFFLQLSRMDHEHAALVADVARSPR